MKARKPAPPVTGIGAPANGTAIRSAENPFDGASGQLRRQDSRNQSHSRAEARPCGRLGENGYCWSTVKRLIEYPRAPPIKTSDIKWAERESLENPTSAAIPYAAYGTQR
jgi:hypothetical protein